MDVQGHSMNSLRLAMWTDIGLPPGTTRDGTWNVNNWIERAFRVIDEVFLDCRRNKRCVVTFLRIPLTN